MYGKSIAEPSRCTRRQEPVLLHIGRHWPGASERGSLATIRMNLRSHALRCSCLLVTLALFGCTSFHREHFLTANSLDRFLTERPDSAMLLSRHSDMEQWLRIEWSKPIANYRIYWSGDQPVVSMADHGFMPEPKLIVIRVSKRLSPEDQLAALCFEICNAQEFSNIEELAAQAATGSLSREDYIRKKSEKEFKTVLRVRDIIQDRLPLSVDEVSATNLYRHLIQAPDDFGEYQVWNSRISNSNYARTLQYYGKEYDELAKRKNNP